MSIFVPHVFQSDLPDFIFFLQIRHNPHTHKTSNNDICLIYAASVILIRLTQLNCATPKNKANRSPHTLLCPPPQTCCVSAFNHEPLRVSGAEGGGGWGVRVVRRPPISLCQFVEGVLVYALCMLLFLLMRYAEHETTTLLQTEAFAGVTHKNIVVSPLLYGLVPFSYISSYRRPQTFQSFCELLQKAHCNRSLCVLCCFCHYIYPMKYSQKQHYSSTRPLCMS